MVNDNQVLCEYPSEIMVYCGQLDANQSKCTILEFMMSLFIVNCVQETFQAFLFK